MIKALNISKRAYLYNLKSNKRVKEKELEKSVVNCFHENKGNYGRPRIKRALSKEGILLSESKIARILKENDLVAKAGRNRKRKIYKKSEAEILNENLLLCKDLNNLTRNEVWSSDITEFKLRTGKLYLAGVIDAASRRLMGFHIATNMRQDIVHQAIKMAVYNAGSVPGTIFHTDRGTQYTSRATQKLLKDLGIISSMSRPGTPNDNQVIESLWNSIKTEVGTLIKSTKLEALKKLYDHAGEYYNYKRMHSGIDYMTPIEAYNNLPEHISTLSPKGIILESKFSIKDATHS